MIKHIFKKTIYKLLLLILLAIPLSIILIPLLFGMDYSSAIPPFIILLIAMLVFLISLPIHSSIIFYFGRPDVFIWVSIGHLIIVGILGYFMISSFGVIGAASTVLIGTIFGFIAPLFWFIKRIKKNE